MIHCAGLISSTKYRNEDCESHFGNFCVLRKLSKQKMGNNYFKTSKYISGKKSFEILIREMKQIIDAYIDIFELFNI
jgi:hypothetical protein